MRLHDTGSGTGNHHVMMAIPRRGHVVIMFPLVCCYDSFGVCGSSLNVLPDIASVKSALVIAPVHSTDENQAPYCDYERDYQNYQINHDPEFWAMRV